MLKLKGDINYRKLQEPRVGVYICHCGGNISDIVDMEQTAGDIAKLPKVIVSRHIQFMCSDSGQETIVKDIQEMGLNRIVVASCSPKLHELTFRHAVERAGLNPYLYQHMNIREQVSWCTHDDPQGATYKATRLVAAAVAKAIRLEPLRPIRMDAYPHVIVVGGGISGLKASLDISKHGIGVTLLEKTPFLGGHTAQLDRVYPTEDKALDIVDELVNQVINEPLIQVYTYAQISCIEGYIGNFKVTIKQQPRGTSKELASVEAAITSCPIEIESNFDYGLSRRKAIYRPYENSRPSLPAIDWQCCNRCGKCANAVGGVGIELDEEPHEFELQAGAIIVAAGFDHYEPHHGEFGYGKYPEVITLPQLTRLLSPNGPTGGRLEWNGQKPKNIAMIHCVGSRQIEGIHNPDDDGKINEYCSRVCCTATLQAANEIREILPDANIFDFYRDIRTYGRGHEDYYENASHNHVLFFRYNPKDPPVVEKSD
ncbi:MAG: CoB--CoM heterodisulfide reductase iron-sulfur subunit A family protein, partial [Chloroflexota bacterium]|nr:CoB--CoM heterodisulfide reductase iron-sulfur subunit A family protein [Chloroflexota bacterium]